MVSDYINDVYDNKSYIENAIYYNNCLAVLVSVNKIFKEIVAKTSKKQEQEE